MARARSSAVGWTLWEEIRRCELWDCGYNSVLLWVGAKELLIASISLPTLFSFQDYHPKPGAGWREDTDRLMHRHLEHIKALSLSFMRDVFNTVLEGNFPPAFCKLMYQAEQAWAFQKYASFTGNFLHLARRKWSGRSKRDVEACHKQKSEPDFFFSLCK